MFPYKVTYNVWGCFGDYEKTVTKTMWLEKKVDTERDYLTKLDEALKDVLSEEGKTSIIVDLFFQRENELKPVEDQIKQSEFGKNINVIKITCLEEA